MTAKLTVTPLGPGRTGIAGVVSAALLSGAAALVSPPRAGAQALEEIVVTARKREESLQETPIAITAFDAAELQALSMSDISMLGDFTPNLNVSFSQGNSGGSNLGANIRGVGQFDFLITTDPGVGVYLDGVYLGRTTGAVLDLLDVARVEVLRGPQGTLFGKNTIGGAINVVTQAPSDALTGEVGLTVGEESRLDGRLSVSGPLAEGLAGSLSLASRNRDGYVERTVDGGELGDVDQLVGRAALAWQLSDRVSLDFSVDHTRQRQGSAPSLLAEVDPAASILPLWNAFVADPAPITPADVDLGSNFFSTEQTGPNRNDLDVTGVSFTLEAALGDTLDLRSITAWRELDAEFGRDGDNTPAQYVHTLNRVDQDQVSQELQLLGNAAGGRLDWLAGAYFYREDASDFNRPRLASGLFDALEALPAPLGPPGAPCAPPFFAPGCPGNPINVALDLDLNVLTEQEVTSYAFFTSLDYALTERLSLNVGLRWTDEEKDFAVQNFRENSGVVILPPGTTASDSWQELSYRAGLDFQSSENVLWYGAVSRGFKSGGFNGRPTAQGAVDSYDPEFLTSYEIGVKADLIGRRLRLNAAVFTNDYEDIQLLVRTVDPVTGSFLSVLQNAAEASVDGIELEATALVSDRVTLGFGLGHLDAEYDDTGGAIEITEDSELAQTPEWNVNASVRYEHPLADGAAIATRLDYGYTSSYFQDAANTASLEEGGYSLLNFRSAYRSPEDTYEVAAFVTNLLDEEYIVSGGSALGTFGTAEYTPARGREWGLSFAYRF